MKNWQIQNNFQFSIRNFQLEKVIDVLLENRGIKTEIEREEFLHPKLEDVTSESVGIDKKQLMKALKRIQKAIEKKEQIVVFGDYDVDGICGSAILWETLHALGAVAIPYIPHRVDQGYGLSIRGIENLLSAKVKPSSKFNLEKPTLIITVDNGIVANDAVDFAKKEGIDVIITDHHVASEIPPKAHAIVHTTKLCGTGVAWLLSQEIKNQKSKIKNKNVRDSGQARLAEAPAKRARMTTEEISDDHLGLVAMATVADLVPLTGANRIVTKFGLEALRTTRRIGLLELFKEAVINQSALDVYTIGHIIGPRLNAMGRMEYAMDSLRLLCTHSKERAEGLAMKLGSTNRQRQVLTQESTAHAIMSIKNYESGIMEGKQKASNLIFLASDYPAGVIGLVAGRLVEEFYKPAIVLSIGETHAKASSRSIPGFNIIEFIRTASEHLVDAGGHPMAAGFTVEKEKIAILQKALEEKCLELLDESLLTRTLRIDCELPLPCIDTSLHIALQQLAPFGMGNPEPVFMSKDVVVEDARLIGRDQKHLKLKVHTSQFTVDCVAFGMGERIKELPVGKTVDIAYTIDENTWNGRTGLQLKIKDIKV